MDQVVDYQRAFSPERTGEESVDRIFASVEDEFIKISEVLNTTLASHTHDDSYYTEAEIDAMVAAQNEFIELTDTPGSFVANKYVRVNTTADSLSFVDIAWVDVSKTGSNLTDLATRQHAGLTNVTTDQHHAQAHTLASHSTKPHSALTDVTSDQHHAEAHGTHLALGESDSTAYRGDRGKSAYDHIHTPLALGGTSTTAHRGDHGVSAYNHIHNLTTDIDHNALTNTHNLTTSIDHNALTNTHNLTTSINHDALTNFLQSEHYVLGATSATAYRGDRGTTAYDHSQASHLALGTSSSTAYRGDHGLSAYNHIHTPLALGTSSSTAYRGDHGLSAYNHISASGASHSYLDQAVMIASNPTFAGVKLGGATYYLGSGAAASKLYTLYINEIYADVGSAGDPSYTFNGNATYGMYMDTAELNFAVAGTRELRLGTTSNSFYQPTYASDHGTAATPMLVNVCYGTNGQPAAGTTPIGTLYIKYTA